MLKARFHRVSRTLDGAVCSWREGEKRRELLTGGMRLVRQRGQSQRRGTLQSRFMTFSNRK